MARELSWCEAIDKVLGAASTPLHYTEIAARQNRRYEDDLSALEFIQCEHPEIKRARGSRPRPKQSWK